MEDHDHHKKKRVGKACDSCRIKKTKCDGKKPCSKCRMDNKICVFTEKKKVKDKVHPSGYVELLETRLTLLTKSLEKIILMSKPYLPFITEILQDEDATSEDTIPINKVVQYLIEKEDLLQNLPGECNEATIAANLKENDEDAGVDSNAATGKKAKRLAINTAVKDEPYSSSVTSNVNGTAEPSDYTTASLFSAKSENESATNNSPNSNSLTESLDLNDYSLGGFSSNILSDNTYTDIFSDFENDAAKPITAMAPLGNTVYDSGFAPISKDVRAGGLENHRAYLNDPPSMTCISTLTNDFANTLTTPRSQSNSAVNKEHHPPTLMRSSSSSMSLSSHHQKAKSNGHIHKPRHTHVHQIPSSLPRSHLSSSSTTSTNSDLSLLRCLSSSSSSPTISPFTTTSSTGKDFGDAMSLPSEAFKNLSFNSNLSIMDTAGIDGLLISNPFLK